MRQLEAFKINWPLWTAYILEQDNWPAKVMFRVEEVLEQYSPRLLEILETDKELYIDILLEEINSNIFNTLYNN